MNIFRGCGGRNSSKAGDFGLHKLFVYAIFFSLFTQVYTVVIEWGLTSLNELNKNRNNWYAPQGGKLANIDLSRGGQVAFVPAFGAGYGLYNRAYPQGEINLYLPKSKDSSSEEHSRKRKRHRRPSSEDYSDYEPKRHHNDEPEHHPKHHQSAKEELNNEHAEQAEISVQMAESLSRMIDFKKSQLATHAQMRDEELSRGNKDAAKKEQAIIDIYQDQIKYLEGIQKAEEAIAAGEAAMYYDDDEAGQKHGHHGKADHHKGEHGHHPDRDSPKPHGADEPRHHTDEDDDDEGPKHHDDDEDEDERPRHDEGDDDDDDDDDDDERGRDYGYDDDKDGNEEHGEHHGNGDGHHGHDEGHHSQGDHHEGGEGQVHYKQDGNDEDEFHDATDKFDEDQGGKHKLDKRSPLVSSFFPSSDTATVQANAEADAVANNVKAQADTSVTTTPSTTKASATADATATGGAAPYTSSSTSATTTTAPLVVNPDANSNSWFSWFGSSNTPTYSPYTLLKYLSPMDKSAGNLMSMFNVFSDPSNSSYLSNASTLMRVVMFFMPGTGVVDQVYFTMALSKIMWEAATMYYDGYGTTEIAVVVLGEMFEASYLSRRGEDFKDSIISQEILTPGDTINIDGMDPPAFLKYVKNMKYPELAEAQEEKLQKDIDNLVSITYPNISSELKTTFTTGLKETLRFLALFNVQGDLRVDNVDVNFSSVYKNMHSAFEDSAIEKIKKTILSAIDAVKSNFN